LELKTGQKVGQVKPEYNFNFKNPPKQYFQTFLR